jgi:uncharacterized membrane protein YeaQ/YmgE (transglycosylase-associated protein family)
MTWKTFFYALGVYFGSFCSYFNIEPLVFVILASAFIFDFITGMTASKMKKTYSSKKGRIMTIAKIFGIMSILLVSLMFKALKIDFDYFILSSFMVLACHDIISSLRHIYYMRTGDDLGEFDAISMLIKKISDKLKELVTKLMQ